MVNKPAQFQNLSDYPRPPVTVDVALLTADKGKLKALLVQRNEPPQVGKWSLPGGFVRLNESLDEAALRVLEAKAGLTDVFLEQLYTFGEPERDPRSRVITVAYYALVAAERLKENRFSLHAPWEGERGGAVSVTDERGKRLKLAFDHADILGMAVGRLRGKLSYSPIGFQLLPERFTLRELQEVHEIILNKRLNKDSFRRKMLASGALKATGDLEQNVTYRPAELYEFIEGSAI